VGVPWSARVARGHPASRPCSALPYAHACRSGHDAFGQNQTTGSRDAASECSSGVVARGWRGHDLTSVFGDVSARAPTGDRLATWTATG
jgi:hypothetical protein